MDWNTNALALCAAALSLVASPAAAQDEPETLTPISSWTLDYGDDSCSLSRVFGTAEAPVVFEMRQYAPATPFYTTVLSRRSMVAEPEVRLTFEGNAPADGVETLWMLDPGEGMSGFRSKLSSAAPRGDVPFAAENSERDAHEAAITYLDVTGAYGEPLRLRTGGMGPPLAAMRDCSLGLIEEWSLDPAAHASLSETVSWEQQNSGFQRVYRRMSDDMRQQYARGNLPVRIVVDAEGQVSSCTALTPFADAEHTSTFCDAITENMRYIPARDAAGNPIASFVVTGVYPLQTVRRTTSR